MAKKSTQGKSPTLEEYMASRAAFVRDSAANEFLKQQLPDVPRVPSQGYLGKGLAFLGVPDNAIYKIAGTEETPFTCIYSATTKYGDKDAAVPGNITFRNNPEQFGFKPVSADVDSLQVGDLVQFTPRGHQNPDHAAMVTGTYWDKYNEKVRPTLSYSRGGTGPTTVVEGVEKPTMAHGRNLFEVSKDAGKPTAFRYYGTPSKQQEWKDEYNRKYGPFRTGTTSRWAEGGQLNNPWDTLSQREKAVMIGVAVQNGITNMPDIRKAYNEFAEGGAFEEESNQFKPGGYIERAKSLIRQNEGWSAKPYKDTIAGKNWRSVGYGFNDSGFTERYPEGISKHYENGITRQQAEQELDWYLGKADRHLRQMYGEKWDSFSDGQKAAILDTYYQRPASVARGSTFYGSVMSGKTGIAPSVAGYDKRNRSRMAAFMGADVEPAAVSQERPLLTDATFVNNPYTQAVEGTYVAPLMVPDEGSYVSAHQLTDGEIKKREFNERMDALQRFNDLMELVGIRNNPVKSLFDGNPYYSPGLFSSHAEGGKIHIKPENRGKFTALKERTGHSASWFKKNGTPAQKKMATFELNARHWKHGDGGHLDNPILNLFAPGGNIFDGITGNTNQMQIGLSTTNGWKPYTTEDIVANAERVEAVQDAIEKRLWNTSLMSNDATSVASGRPQNRHLESRSVEGAKAHAAWEAEHPIATAVGYGLGAAPFAVAAYPFMAAAGEFAAPILTNPYVDAAITSGFAGHGLNHAINEGIDGWGDTTMTALEITPLGRVISPIAKEASTAATSYIRNRALSNAFKVSDSPANMEAVNRGFRNNEWSNFLSTRNGDNYYRMANMEKEAKYGYSPEENYFVSHTTPWEEFSGSGRNISDAAMLDNGITTNFHDRLYEFPTKTFGTRNASSWKGAVGDTDVSVMGRKHLLYGDTSSGVRGPVRIMSDENAEYLGISPFKIGVADRPLTSRGFYNGNPVYEDIHMGNQTVLNGSELQNAIDNTTYNLFERTPLGIVRKIHLGK